MGKKNMQAEAYNGAHMVYFLMYDHSKQLQFSQSTVFCCVLISTVFICSVWLAIESGSLTVSCFHSTQ